MAIRSRPNPETQFNRGAWLILFTTLALMIGGITILAYRFTLPTDGWEVNEAGDLPGLIYSKNLMGNPSRLQPGDQVTAIEGIPADWQTIHLSPMIQEAWRAGATLDYTVLRGGKEVHVPVSLSNWQIGKWLQVSLLDPGKLAGFLSGIILLALAGFIFLRQPGNPAAGAFLIIMAIMAAAELSETLPLGFPEWIDPIAKVLQNKIVNFILFALFPFALIRFALVFPHPKPIHQRHPWLSWAAGAIGLILMVFALENPISWFWLVFSIFLAVTILIHNAFTMRDTVSRAQIRWGLGGFIIGFGTLALILLAGTLGFFGASPNTSNLVNLISAFATTVMGGMLAVAILRYRLFDIDVIIRRTLQYALLTGLLVLVYFGSVVLLQSLVENLTGQQSPIVIVISTLAIAALFNPLRKRVQSFIDQRFYRKKYNAEQALESFAATARDEVDMDKLTRALLNVVEETLQPESVSLLLMTKKSRLWANPMD